MTLYGMYKFFSIKQNFNNDRMKLPNLSKKEKYKKHTINMIQYN